MSQVSHAVKKQPDKTSGTVISKRNSNEESLALTHMIKRASNPPNKSKERKNISEHDDNHENAKDGQSDSEDDDLSELPDPVACVSLRADEDVLLPDPVSHHQDR